MAVDLSQHPEKPAKVWPAGKTLLVSGALVAAAFLAGFVPSYLRKNGVEAELRVARHENRMAQLRDLAGLTYLQASQKNYGLAAGTSARFFQSAREVADQTSDSAEKKALEDLLARRDQTTSELAKGEPAVLSNLEALFVKTRQATGAGAGGS